MNMLRLSSLGVAISLGLLAGCNSDHHASAVTPVADYQYSTKAVYAPQQMANTYEVAPTGFSPVFTELVARLRIDRACHLLTHTHQPLAQIAQECGFGDQSYFTRVFRQRTGRTPGDYRAGGPTGPE